MASDCCRFTIGGENLEPRGVAMWDIGSGRVLWKKRQKDGYDWVPLCFAPDGKTLAMGHYRSPFSSVEVTAPGVVICDAATGKSVVKLPTSDSASDAAFSRDGQQLTIADGPNIVVWDVAARRQVSRLKIVPTTATSQTFSDFTLSRDGQQILVNWIRYGSTPSVPLRAELRDLKNTIQWKAPGQLTGQTLFSPDGRWLLRCAAYSFQFEVRDAATGAFQWKHTVSRAANDYTPRRGVWLPDSSGVVLPDDDKFRVWDARTGREKRSVPHLPQVGNNFTVSSDANALYAIVDDDNYGIGASNGGQIWRQRLR